MLQNYVIFRVARWYCIHGTTSWCMYATQNCSMQRPRSRKRSTFSTREDTTTFSIGIARSICSWSKPSLQPLQGVLTTVSGVRLSMFAPLPCLVLGGAYHHHRQESGWGGQGGAGQGVRQGLAGLPAAAPGHPIH